MKNILHKYKIILILVAIVIVSSYELYSTFEVEYLIIRAEMQDVPSKKYYDIVESIYNKIDKNNISRILSDLDNNKSKYLHDMYIHTLGVLGYNDKDNYYYNLLLKYDAIDKDNLSIINNIYLSMGLSGGNEYCEILKKALQDEGNINIAYRRYIIAMSLYLLTGESYLYVNPRGIAEKFEIHKYMIDARNVILVSNGRKRTYDEMIVLDKLTRPHGW